MPFFKPVSYMETKKEMRATSKQQLAAHNTSRVTQPSASASTLKNKSLDTLVDPTTNDDSPIDPAEQKEPLSALERIKLEREYEKAHPRKPLKPAEGIWKSRLMVIPTAVLYGFGGGWRDDGGWYHGIGEMNLASSLGIRKRRVAYSCHQWIEKANL
jgi:hypothetical protein